MQACAKSILQAGNLYMFVMHNPIMFIDPLGLMSWVFYCAGDFHNQAVAEAGRLGNDTRLIPVWTLDDFIAGWDYMIEFGEITNVSMIFHGSPFTITFIDEQNRFTFLTSSNQSITPRGAAAFYIGDLQTATIGGRLNIMTCNGGHINFINSNAQFRELGFYHNFAVSFLVNHNVAKVFGMDGNLSFTRFLNYFPRLSRDQGSFHSWSPPRWRPGNRQPEGKVMFFYNRRGNIAFLPMWW